MPNKSIQQQKARALELILNAWEQASQDGVESELIASSAIFAALAEMVDLHGPEAVAEFCAGLPARVKAGEFTLQPLA
jgi:hypothetical protein